VQSEVPEAWPDIFAGGRPISQTCQAEPIGSLLWRLSDLQAQLQAEQHLARDNCQNFRGFYRLDFLSIINHAPVLACLGTGSDSV